jgi:hypothetical protein
MIHPVTEHVTRPPFSSCSLFSLYRVHASTHASRTWPPGPPPPSSGIETHCPQWFRSAADPMTPQRRVKLSRDACPAGMRYSYRGAVVAWREQVGLVNDITTVQYCRYGVLYTVQYRQDVPSPWKRLSHQAPRLVRQGPNPLLPTEYLYATWRCPRNTVKPVAGRTY